jgi:hypothetical protein
MEEENWDDQGKDVEISCRLMWDLKLSRRLKLIESYRAICPATAENTRIF